MADEEKQWSESDMAASIGLFLLLVVAAGVAALLLKVGAEKAE